MCDLTQWTHHYKENEMDHDDHINNMKGSLACGRSYADYMNKSQVPAYGYRNLLLTTCFLVGIGFKTKAAIEHCKTLEQGALLHLERERENEFDPNAVLVVAPSFGSIGYVPRANNDVIATLMDHGYPIHAALLEVTDTKKLNQRYIIGLYFHLV